MLLIKDNPSNLTLYLRNFYVICRVWLKLDLLSNWYLVKFGSFISNKLKYLESEVNVKHTRILGGMFRRLIKKLNWTLCVRYKGEMDEFTK